MNVQTIRESLKDLWERVFVIEHDEPESTPPVEPGLYHAMEEAAGMYTRFHLRVEHDGSGLLIANAAAAAQLSPSGAVIAKGLLDGQDETEILDRLRSYFEGGTEEQMREDIAQVTGLIRQITHPHDAYPLFTLNDAAFSPYEAQLIAPLQATVPLADPTRMSPLLRRLWEVGIPNVTVLVPEEFEREDLIRAIELAEDLGMIAGVRGRATDLWDEDLLQDVMMAGVDHVTVLYAATDPALHDALCGAGDHAAATALFGWLEAHEICAIAEMPLTQRTAQELEATVEEMAELGVDNIAFVAYVLTDEPASDEKDNALASAALPQLEARVEEAATRTQMRFLWVPPMPRRSEIPLAAQVRQGPRCAEDTAVRVEPNGEVIPSRGPIRSVGNILKDDWETIWQHDAFRIYREKVAPPLTHNEQQFEYPNPTKLQIPTMDTGPTEGKSDAQTGGAE
jgi:MoaA/NifB/PqqE/SkfB family radical SAM enzyme